jgi:hypothetical protein
VWDILYVYIIPWMVSYFIPYLPRSWLYAVETPILSPSPSRPHIASKGRYGMKYETIHGIIYLSHAYLQSTVRKGIFSGLFSTFTYRPSTCVTLRDDVPWSDLTLRYVSKIRYVTLNTLRSACYVTLCCVTLCGLRLENVEFCDVRLCRITLRYVTWCVPRTVAKGQIWLLGEIWVLRSISAL